MENHSPVRWFLALATAAGLLYALLIPPFQSPDEPAHFFRAWQVSEGVFLPTRTPDARLGGWMPASLDSLHRRFSFLKNDYAARTTPAAILAAGKLPLAGNNQMFQDFPNTAIYAPTAYLPQALAIALLRPLHVPPLWMLYAGRLANLAVCILLLLAALRRMPFQSHLMAITAALPAGLVMAASLNADVVTNGLAFWLVAGLLQGASAGKKRLFTLPFGLLLAATVIIAINKIIYLPIVGVFWLGNLSFRRGRAWAQFSLLVFSGLLAAGLWGQWANAQFVPFDQYNPAFRAGLTLNEGVDPGAQLRQVGGAPGHFLFTVGRSLWHALPSTAAHVVGKFGWEKNYVQPIVLALLWLGLAVCAMRSHNPLRWAERVWAACLIAAIVLLFAVTMYALWCPVGSTEITNWQGRYFVPLLPLIGLLMGKQVMKGDGERWGGIIWTTIKGIWWLAQGAMVWAIWMRYYG